MSDVLIRGTLSLVAGLAAQVAERRDFDWPAYAIWTAVVVALVVTTLLVLRYVRRTTIEGDGEDDTTLFDLGELCDLRDRGELTQEQYERLSEAALTAIDPLHVLNELRELRDSGRLRVPDYDTLRARAVERIKAANSAGTSAGAAK